MTTARNRPAVILIPGLLMSARERDTLRLPLTFTHGDDVIDGQVLQYVYPPVRPRDLQTIDLCRVTEAYMHAHVVLREVARSASHLIDECSPTSSQPQLRANAVAVRFPGAYRPHEQRVVAVA